MNGLNNNNQCHYPTKQEQQEPACLWSTPSTPSCSDMSSPQSPAAETNPDYAVYHVPKGYDVLLVPKPDEPALTNPESPLNSTIDDSSSDCAYSQTSSKPMDIPKSNKPNSDDTTNPTTTTTTTTTSTRLSAYRKRKADKNYIPRPKNCFMAYREHIKEKFLTENPGLNNKVVSVLAAKMWNGEPESVKEYWRERAKQLKLEHKLKYPDYKFKPQKKKQNLKTPSGVKTPSKTIRKKTLGSDKHIVFSDGYAAEMLGDSDEGKLMYAMPLEGAEEQDDIYMNMPHLHKKAFFGHYRASSVDSISSWTSDSTVSTPLLSPFVGSPASLSPPSFQLCNQLSRSSSALRYEAGNVARMHEGPHGNMILSSHNLAMINEVDQLNQMYNQMDVNVRAALPVDDGFVLDSSSSYDESSLRVTNPFFNQSLACSTTQPEMSTTDYDLMAMGHVASPIPEEEGFYVDYNSVDAYQGFNSSYDLSSQGSTSSLAEHYALALDTPRRNSQQSLAEFQQNMRQQELVLQSLLD